MLLKTVTVTTHSKAACFGERSSAHAKTSAFSLIELLAVIAISMVLMTVSGPVVSALSNAGGVNKAAADFARTLELSRSYAMSHQTYVRLAIATVPPSAAAPDGAVLILPIASADGTLAADGSTDMADTSVWPAIGRPFILQSFEIRDPLNASTPDTTQDALPSSTDIAVLHRTVPRFGVLDFQSYVQFAPSGVACVKKDSPARHIKIALDKRNGQAGRNALILRVAGSNGVVSILRQEDGIQ